MPEFRLISYGERLLYDNREYIVTAETREAAATLLMKAQAEVDACGRPINGYPEIRRINPDDNVPLSHVLPLKPESVVDEDSGVVELDADGEVVWTFGHDEATRMRNLVSQVLTAVDEYDTEIHGSYRTPDGHDYVALWSIVQRLRERPPNTFD